MGSNDDFWTRWRVAAWLVGAQLLVIVVAVIAFGARGEAHRSTAAASSATSAAPQAAWTPSATPIAIGASAVPARVVASIAPARPSASVKLPDGVSATFDSNFGDPFESWNGAPSEVRTLTTSGDVRLGVTRASKMKDEYAVTDVLKALGAELDALDRGRTDSMETRAHEYEPLMKKYRDKLAPLMDGAFAVHGNGWSDVEPIDRPQIAASASASSARGGS